MAFGGEEKLDTFSRNGNLLFTAAALWPHHTPPPSSELGGHTDRQAPPSVRKAKKTSYLQAAERVMKMAFAVKKVNNDDVNAGKWFIFQLGRRLNAGHECGG